MKLCCPMGCGWTVAFAGAKDWQRVDALGPAGARTEFVTGHCETCRSLVLTDPSPVAVEAARKRLAAAGMVPGG